MANDKEIDPHLLDDDTTYDPGREVQDLIKSSYKETGEEQSFDVVIGPDARVASLEPSRLRASPRSQRREVPLPQTSASSARQSRSRLMQHVVAQSLRVCMTLTYRVVGQSADDDLTEFVRDAKRHYGSEMEWASVTEGGGHVADSRIHHHVFLPLHTDLHKVASEWVHGDVHVGINADDESMRRAVNYVSKSFMRSSGQTSRYRRSRRRKMTRVRRRVVGIDAAAEAIAKAIGVQATGVRIVDPKCGNRRMVYWDNPYKGV